MKTRILILLLAAILLLPCLCACADTGKENQDSTKADVEVEEDIFADVDYEGREFWIYTSTNIASTGMGNSNFMIEGSEEEADSSDIVGSAVYKRNLDTEELLGVNLEYVHCDLMYTMVADDIKKHVTSGSDEFDLIINDLFPLAGLSVNGYFVNTLDDEYHFDFDQKYWYSDYMTDVSFVEGYQFLLAGDYFADIIRSAHCLIYNKSLYEDKYGNPDELYDIVLDYEWTQERMLQMIEENYVDLNGNGKADEEDRYGYAICDIWGCSIPLITSGDCNYMDRDSETGYPIITIDNPRTYTLTESIYNLMYSKGTGVFAEQELLNEFARDKALIVGYQRLGSLEHLRDMENDLGIIPYPMLLASDKQYTTSSHDTTEVGVIMTTAIYDMDFISTVLEVLNRETGKTVMPQYYETALKVKYTDDPQAGAMIDIIHDNFRNVFELAYDNAVGEPIKTVIYGTIAANSFNVSSKLAKSQRSCQKRLNTMISQCEKNFIE
ncbi:MAG: hypothetical protein E7581_00195 [Ruminococcaceae bacterium]|nr:hypothetical protein [Oscillospiraceae bacterium]